MKIRNSFTRSLIALALFSLTGSAILADVIKLKDGSVLRGKVTSYSQRKFTIVVYIGGASSQHVVPVDEIESVEFDGVEAMAGAAPRNDVTAPPVEVSAPAPVSAEPERPVNREPAPVAAPANEPPTQPASEGDAGLAATLAEKSVSVAAAADWTSTEIRVQKGQRISISASGEIDLGDNKRSGPDGQASDDRRKLIPDRPTGALIAVVGDDNDDFFFVGNSSEFVARHNGILFLSINEGNLKDNSGAFTARVKVLSSR